MSRLANARRANLISVMQRDLRHLGSVKLPEKLTDAG